MTPNPEQHPSCYDHVNVVILAQEDGCCGLVGCTTEPCYFALRMSVFATPPCFMEIEGPHAFSDDDDGQCNLTDYAEISCNNHKIIFTAKVEGIPVSQIEAHCSNCSGN